MAPVYLRHGYTWRAAKYDQARVPLRDTAALIGHHIRTHIRHDDQGTDNVSTKAAAAAAEAGGNMVMVNTQDP